MAIERKELVQGHNPELFGFDYDSPMTIGNGEFAFNADITGLQTFYEQYEDNLPLCTQSQWGWHTTPVSEDRYSYTREDLKLNPFDTYGRQVGYAKQKVPGNEEVYDWLRKNPHRLNLGRIGFALHKRDGSKAGPEDITNVYQELDLYDGALYSRFKVEGIPVAVRTCVHPTRDMIAVEVHSELIPARQLWIELRFPYGSPDKGASDWENTDGHSTEAVFEDDGIIQFRRTLDRDEYYVTIRETSDNITEKKGRHIISVNSKTGNSIKTCIEFSPIEKRSNIPTSRVFRECETYWNNYWEEGGVIRLRNSSDPRGRELERRIILSQYLTACQCCGTVPPQETGLTCNSWYGKAHLEMHFWHAAHFHFWNRTSLLERSMQWYIDHLSDAKALAASQGYKGARWMKMVGINGVDSPSSIAPLLIWQQPHIIWYLESCYQDHPNSATLKKYAEVMFETAEFMADFAVWDGKNGRYVLGPPCIPAQERHDAATCLNPTYEVEYWVFGLKIACRWKERLGETPDRKWVDVMEKMAHPLVVNNTYMAQENCPETFEKVNTDHPSMLCAYGLINSGRIDSTVMDNTLTRVLNEWDFPSMWGWDFGVMAMTATVLGRPEVAVDILLKDTEKNRYVVSGNNRQDTRKDLPLYLPGNGSLLLATAMMAAGYEGCKKNNPGFPQDGSWTVEYENIRPFWFDLSK